MAIDHFGSSIWSQMRRTIGAILMLTRPERISRSAWRGEARKASKPKRATSTRLATIDIISIAQQARPKVAGNIALPRAQATALSSVVVMIDSSTCFCRSAPSRSPASMSRARSCRIRKSCLARSTSEPLWRITSIRGHPCARRR